MSDLNSNHPSPPREVGTITLERGSFGWDYIVRHADGRDLLVQVDYDYAGIASSFGWYVGSVPAAGPRAVDDIDARSCEHGGTDGTVDCDACGTTVSEFLASAADYLDAHIGESVADPGYFADSPTAPSPHARDCRTITMHPPARSDGPYCIASRCPVERLHMAGAAGCVLA